MTGVQTCALPICGSNIKTQVLDSNYRSAPALIRWFNAYARAAFDNEPSVSACAPDMLALSESPRAFLIKLAPALDAKGKHLAKNADEFDKNGEELERRLLAALTLYLISPMKERATIRAVMPFDPDVVERLDASLTARCRSRAVLRGISETEVSPFDAAEDRKSVV